MTKKYVLKESTKKRCRTERLNRELLGKYLPINLDGYNLLFDSPGIEFNIYVKIDDLMVEYIKPAEFTRVLLESALKATLEGGADVRLYILRSEIQKFFGVLDDIRERKIKSLIEKDPSIDPKTLYVFNDLSGASQMIASCGINPEVASKAKAAAAYMVTNLMDNELAAGSLSRMISTDPSLYDHCASVAMFAGIIAGQNNSLKKMDRRAISTLVQAGLYHDVGKPLIPSHILNKPGSFTNEEFEIMKRHSRFGHTELVKSIEKGAPIDPMVPRVALEHHERMNGSGYPDGKRGREENDPVNGIHLYSRIIAVADAYSALLMKRVYKPAVPAGEALKLMSKNALTDFDAEIFNSFAASVVSSMEKVQNRAKGNIYMMDIEESIAKQILKNRLNKS
ncbi:MAG: HD domain-containing protein [Oligoflexales bacterium]|nr:HD domain-containing protein [Oligoflexales bacterium]